MQIKNILQFSENHSFYTTCQFSLSPLSYKMLAHIYQPIVGAFALSLYQLLYQLIPSEQMGSSQPEQQRMLFMSMGLEPNDKGKKFFIDQTSKLEAVGLLQTARLFQPNHDEFLYEYALVEPLSPDEFFNSQHLSLLLRDKIGKHMLQHMKHMFHTGHETLEKTQMLDREELSVPFYEMFRLNPQAVDEELEQASAEAAASIAHKNKQKPKLKGFQYAEIIMRFPKDAPNRLHVESLKQRADQLDLLNYIVNKYDLSLLETVRLLDEDDTFNSDGELELENLQHKANLNYRQGKKRDEDRERFIQKLKEQETSSSDVDEKAVEERYYLDIPEVFSGQCDIHQYNMMLKNDPYTRVLERFFPGSIPDHILNIFERIDLNYKLNEEVINVLIHYLKVYNLAWNRGFIESIASDMLGKEVSSYETAVAYIRARTEIKGKQQRKGKIPSTSKGRSGKPNIPIIEEAPKKDTSLSEEELEEIRQIAAQLNAK
jgi:replication initiation and membrane attachment protein